MDGELSQKNEETIQTTLTTRRRRRNEKINVHYPVEDEVGKGGSGEQRSVFICCFYSFNQIIYDNGAYGSKINPENERTNEKKQLHVVQTFIRLNGLKLERQKTSEKYFCKCSFNGFQRTSSIAIAIA